MWAHFWAGWGLFMTGHEVERCEVEVELVFAFNRGGAAAAAPQSKKARSTLGIVLLPVLLMAMACASKPLTASSEASSEAGPASPGQSPPAGFQSYRDAQGSGQLLFAKLGPGAHSARAVMRDSLAGLKSYFDGPPRLQGAVSDPQDQVVQVILSAQLHGQPVRGVATAAIAPSGATFGLVFDRPEALKASFQRLSQRLAQEMPKGSGGGAFDLSAPKEWSRQTAGDRTCAVDLPTGWRITACKEGIATIVGPDKELIQLGMIFFVSTTPTSYGMSSRYLQPAQAFSYFVNYFTQVNLRQGINLNSVPGRVLEVKEIPPPMPNGKGAYLLQEVATNGHAGKVFALVYTVPNLMTGWSLYTSYVSAPAEVFPPGICRHDANLGFVESG